MTNDERRWQAVEGRDRTSDGTFVFAVTSTGIFCRPSCPARRPKRENVRFFADAAAAEAAGFRACRRCMPKGDAPATRLARRARTILDAHETMTLAALATKLGVSPHHLQRVFKREVGVTPKQYVAARRLDRLKGRLKEGEMIATATYEAGYGSSSRLYEGAAAQLGMTPGAYRDGGRGMEIRYLTTETSIGSVLVATTERGICAVTIGDSSAELIASLEEEFPNATRTAATDDELTAIVRDVVDGNGAAAAAVPLDLRATTFQLRVWNALRANPRGETRTYAEVAEAIGEPRAVRAVANACASNRVAMVIPCHRVVRTDGTLGGYRWGVARKRKLLQREQAR